MVLLFLDLGVLLDVSVGIFFEIRFSVGLRFGIRVELGFRGRCKMEIMFIIGLGLEMALEFKFGVLEELRLGIIFEFL